MFTNINSKPIDKGSQYDTSKAMPAMPPVMKPESLSRFSPNAMKITPKPRPYTSSNALCDTKLDLPKLISGFFITAKLMDKVTNGEIIRLKWFIDLSVIKIMDLNVAFVAV